MQKTKTSASLLGAINSAKGGIVAFLLLSACAGMTAIGAGCEAYAEARLSMPELGDDPLSFWIADLDDRMTGACR